MTLQDSFYAAVILISLPHFIFAAQRLSLKIKEMTLKVILMT
jgi:hypothetical protein